MYLRFTIPLASAALFLGALSGKAQTIPKPLLSDEMNTIQIFRQTSAGVVQIDARLTVSSPFETRPAEESAGTGFVIDKDGRILTAFHVVKDKDEIAVTLSNHKRYNARLIGTAPQLDIALLQIDASPQDLVALPLGSSEGLQVGQKVLAIGNAVGLQNTLSVGVISAVQRTMDDSALELSRAVIQTDAAINPGNSGGPLLSSSGEVIGINDAVIRGAQNLGFAIPIDLAHAVIPDLIEMGHVYHPTLGFSGTEITPEVARLFGIPIERGFMIEEVLPDSPAAVAGLQAGKRVVVVGQKFYTLGGDVIVAINGEAVTSPADIAKTLLRGRPGEVLKLRLYRQGQTLEVSVPLLAMDMKF